MEGLYIIGGSPCSGKSTIAEMIAEKYDFNYFKVDDYLEQYIVQDKISYVHFRNVKGKVPCYDEVFVDEGDIDMFRVLRQLKRGHFNGVLVPDHTPLMTCAAPWHAGMAYALGYMKAAFQMLEREDM